MALSQKHRSVLFDDLSPRVGEDVTEALMAECPAREGDELVTEDFLRAERAELGSDVVSVRSDLMIRLTGVIGVAAR